VGTPVVAFVAMFVAMLIVALLQGAKPFYYDSGVYWGLADSFVRDGHFSLLNFDSPLRGYLLPLVNDGLQEVSAAFSWNDSSSAKVFNALVFSLVTTVLAPAFAEQTWPERRWGLGRRLLLATVVIVFWRGYLNFPLSDFPAIAAVLLALIGVGRTDRPGWMLVAGLAGAAAINMRPAYLLLMPVLVSLVAYGWWRQRGTDHPAWSRRGLCVALALLGFVVLSLPQSLSAHRHNDTWSFVPGAAAGLSSLQFTEGMRMQRYDTFVGTGQPSARMIFADPRAGEILDEREGGTIANARQYARVVVTHPAIMAGLFGRHVVNGLDARYPTPYIEQVDTGGNRCMRLAGFLLVFLALVRVAWPRARRMMGTARWQYPVALLACGATSLASAVETRFLLPAYLLSYVLVLAPGWTNPLTSTEPGLRRFRTPVVLALALVVFFAVVLSVVGNATDNLRFG
jgi:hypothetical protein